MKVYSYILVASWDLTESELTWALRSVKIRTIYPLPLRGTKAIFMDQQNHLRLLGTVRGRHRKSIWQTN